MSEERLYRTSEVAKILGADKRSVQRYINKGEFPNAFKSSTAPNSHWRIPESDVKAYLEKIGRKWPGD